MDSRPEGICAWTERNHSIGKYAIVVGGSGQCLSGKPDAVETGRTDFATQAIQWGNWGALVLLYPFGKGTGILAQWGLGGKVPILVAKNNYVWANDYYVIGGTFSPALLIPIPSVHCFLPLVCLV